MNQQAASASKTDEILNKQLEHLVRLYGDLTLQREDIDSKLVSCRADIMRLQAVAPVCMQVEQAVAGGRVSAPPVALGPVLPIPSKKPETPRKKRGRKSNAERAAIAAAAASAVKAKPNGAQLVAN